MDAIRVPRPPRFVPMISAAVSSVNPDRSRAAGTLLVTCEARTATSTSRPARMACSQPEKAGMRPRLPMKTKNATKVSSRE